MKTTAHTGATTGASPAAPSAGGDAGVPASAVTVDVIETDDLFRGRRELLIRHAGNLYRLRITQNDKLILTK